MVLHGNSEVAVDDVCDVGKSIRVKFKSDRANMFNVLSRVEDPSRHGGGCVVGSKSLSEGV